MTVLRRTREPEGTYVDGYDAGLRDAAEGQTQRYTRPSRRMVNASFYRYGYADGYADGRSRR